MKRIVTAFALLVLAIAGTASAAPKLYDHPTWAQMERAIAAAQGVPYVPRPSPKTDPTFDQMERLIKAVGSGGGGITNAVTLEAFAYATNRLDLSKVGTNDFVSATNELHVVKRDKDDLAVYRKVKDIWTWTTHYSNKWSTAEAPADFLETANSPGTMPLYFRGGKGAHGGWFGANQYWPSGNLKYDQGYDFSGDEGELSKDLYFAFTAYAEDGHTELFRFGAHAHRESATDETLVDWDGKHTDAKVAVNQSIRIATTDMVNRGLKSKVGTNEFNEAMEKVGQLADGKQKYLRVMDFADTFDTDADWYADWADEHGYCASMRLGNVYVRNYDWKYTEAMTYVGRLSATTSRYASVFVCNVGTNLTPAIEATGEWTRFHRALPGRAVDGINERGVVCNINVVPTNGSPWETSGGVRNLSLTRACRYVLDNFSSATNAARYVADHGYVPESLKKQGFSLHMMIADEQHTCIVEDGMVLVTGPFESATPMTNFRVVNTHVPDPYGSGRERYGVLKGATTETGREELALAAAITNVWYTKGYIPSDGVFPWPTEFAGTVVVTNSGGRIVDVVEHETGDPWEHKIRNDEPELLQEACQFVIPDVPHDRWPRNGLSWQTIHCSVYDISNRCLRIAVQEDPRWTVVSVPAGGTGGIDQTAAVDLLTKTNVFMVSGAVSNSVVGILTDEHVRLEIGSHGNLTIREGDDTRYDSAVETDSRIEDKVTTDYIRSRLGLYLYVGDGGGIYVHTED